MLLLIIPGLMCAAGVYLALLAFGVKLPPASWRGRKVGAYVGIPLALLSIEAGILLYVLTQATSLQEALKHTYVNTAAKLLAAGMRERVKLPVHIDDAIDLTGFSGEDGKMIYEYTLTAVDPNESAFVLKQVQDNMQKTGCAREDYQKMLKAGVSIELRFNERARPYMSKMLFTPENCGL